MCRARHPADREPEQVDPVESQRIDERDHPPRRLPDRAAELARRGPDTRIVDEDDLALGGERVGHRGVPVVEVAAEVLQQDQRHYGRAPKAAVREVHARRLEEPCLGRRVGDGRGDGHERSPVTESRMSAAYSSGASSQTKWPASMIRTRLLGSRSARNSALASGTTWSLRPLMIVTGVAISGSSSASSGSSCGYRRT